MSWGVLRRHLMPRIQTLFRCRYAMLVTTEGGNSSLLLLSVRSTWPCSHRLTDDPLREYRLPRGGQSAKSIAGFPDTLTDVP